ncbi:DUF58 domain-containing protein, partial [Patulibacter sp. S7RM1-6]
MSVRPVPPLVGPAPPGIAVAIALAFGAAALGSVALFAIALGVLVVLVGAAVVVRVAARRVRVTRTVVRRGHVEGRPVELTFAARGLGGLPVHLEALDADGRWRALPPGGGRQTWTLDRPGAHLLRPSPLRVRDDLGLFARAVAAGTPEVLLALPEPLAPPRTTRTGGSDPVGDPEPDGLRAYVPGTPVGRIHWRSAARGGELQERAFTVARQGLPLVVVDTAGVEDGPAVDWAARTAAGQILALARTGGCRVLLPGDRAPTVVADA